MWHLEPCFANCAEAAFDLGEFEIEARQVTTRLKRFELLERGELLRDFLGRAIVSIEEARGGFRIEVPETL